VNDLNEWLNAVTTAVTDAPVLTAVMVLLAVLLAVLMFVGCSPIHQPPADIPPTDVCDRPLTDDELDRLWGAVVTQFEASHGGPPLRHGQKWCGGPITCDTHHVELCTDRPCCSMCPTREDTTR
jgi:hypothetical protein